MAPKAPEPRSSFAVLFDRRVKEVLGSEAERARVGDLAYEYYKKSFGCSQPMFKSTVCSEISGVNWFDLNEVAHHYFGPRGPETIEKCAGLTGTTAAKVAEIPSQLQGGAL